MTLNRLIPRTAPPALVIVTLLVTISLSGCIPERLGRAYPNVYWGNVPDEEEMKALKARGVKTIINVRTNPLDDRAEAARKLGLNFIHIRTGVIRKPRMSQIREFLRIARDPKYQPVYVGCVGGRDRTAFYLAVYAMAEEGISAEEAAKRMDEHGLRPYWITFRLYDEVLSEHEEEIRNLPRPGRTARSTAQAPVRAEGEHPSP